MKNSHLSDFSPSTPININLLEQYLKNYPDPNFSAQLCQGLRHGFDIGYQGPRRPSVSPNLKSALIHPHIIDENLLDEVQQGRTAGPFDKPPFPNFQIYPIGIVPKKHSQKWRTIFHLSYPKGSGTSVNDNIPAENYSLQYIRLDNAIKMVLDLGQNCYMAKTDIKSAFRNIPVRREDWELLGMHWRDMYFFDTVLPFGLRSAPYLFNLLSDALEWILKNHVGVPRVLHILDDFFIAEPPPASNCATSLCKLLHLFTELDVPLAPNKTFKPSTTLEFLGITIDSNKMEARLPEDKLDRARSAVSQWATKKSCKLKDLQSLIGTLQFACCVIAPGRPFLQRMIRLTCGIQKPHYYVHLNGEFRKDLRMWGIFLQGWNGVSLFLDPNPTSSLELQLFTDASGAIGFGGFFHNAWFQGKWEPHQQINKSKGISIDWQEYFPIVIACELWGAQWANKRITFRCDNTAVVAILNSKSSKAPRIMDLVRHLTLLTLIHNFSFTAQHVPGSSNKIADALSRFQMERFRKLAPKASTAPCVIPSYMMQL